TRSFQRASLLQNLQRASAVDALTVKLTLARPNSSFFNGLLDDRLVFAPREMDYIGGRDPKKMAGIWGVQVNQGSPPPGVTHKRYSEFRAGEPHFDAYKVIFGTGDDDDEQAFVARKTQAQNVARGDTASRLRAQRPDTNLYSWVSQNWAHLRPSVKYPPFADA